MPALHISKVAFGCARLETFRRRQEKRREGDTVPIITRFRPKRADELIGGSIYWIIKHRIIARQTILGFEERAEDRRTIIRLAAEVVPVRAQAKRAHQGWRYLAAADAPDDFGDGDGIETLPGAMVSELSRLALI